MAFKICCRCKKELPHELFSKNNRNNDRKENACKSCISSARRNAYLLNSQKYKERALANYRANRERRTKQMSFYAKTNRNSINARISNRYHTDFLFRLRESIRRRLKRLLTKGQKCPKVEEMLGCTVLELQKFIGERPENYSLDHICPLAQARDMEELIKLNHYTNLRWIPVVENSKKGARFAEEGGELCKILLGREWEMSHG